MHPWEIREREWAQKAIQNDTYVGPNGELRWKSNDSVLMLDTFEEAGIQPPANQAMERDKDVDQAIAAYKAARMEHDYSEEELFEMRAAFGEGAEVVDVLTGHRIKL